MNDRFGMEAAEEFTNGRVLERFCFVYVVLKVYSFIMAQWLSWLERRPVTAEVESSSLFWVVIWDLSSAGRASALQAEGHRFEPCRSHFADVAQLAEQLICNQQVNGSSPFIGFANKALPARVHGPLAQLVRATGS